MARAGEERALEQIRAYLDAGHALSAVRDAGWGEWIDHFESKSVRLDVTQLDPPSARPPVEGQAPAEEITTETEPELVQAATSDHYVTNGGTVRRIRHRIGYALIGIWAVLDFVIQIAIYVSLATGIWWPLTQVIIDDPVSAIWIIPIGFFITGLSAMILRFIYGLLLMVVAIPGGALTMWLLRDADGGDY